MAEARLETSYLEVLTPNLGNSDARLETSYLEVLTVVTPSTPVSVSAPVLAVTEAVPAPTVTMGSSVSVAAPVLALSVALLAPVASVGSSVNVAAPALAVSYELVAPDVIISTAAVVDAPVLDLSVAVPVPTVTAGTSVVVSAPVLELSFAVPAPSVLTVVDMVRSPVDIGSSILSAEGEPTHVDYPVVGSPVRIGSVVRNPLVPVEPTLGVLTEWPIERQAHLMPALSAANPRYRPYVDYDIDREEVGRLHVFLNGTDVTYMRNVPARFADYTTSLPLWSASASIDLPQIKPWDEPGVGDLAVLDMSHDPAIEIALVRPGGEVEQKWEGFLASDEDTSGENREDYSFHAEGLFVQAMHELYDPPVYMEPTDPAHIVADVLNSVTHRRWNAIPKVSSGLPKVLDRGKRGQTKWQRVQDVLSKMVTLDGRQWTLRRTAPYTFALQLKADTDAADWTVTKGAPGVACSFVVDQASRRDCVYGRGYAPDGGHWEGRVFPGLEFGVPPTYPMAGFANITVGTSDSETTTGNGVTTWQRQMRELGYPVTVDGVMNSADTYWVYKIQKDRGLTYDGSLGPQTWAATWENNSTDVDLTTYRRPLAWIPGSEPFVYSASGARIGLNPEDDPTLVVHGTPEIDFGSGIKKSDAIKLAEKILARESTPGVQGKIVLTTDPHEDGASRFDIEPGQNIHVVGHRGGTTFQISEVSVNDLEVTLTVDSKARDALAVQAILDRNEDARRDVSSRTGANRDASSLNKSAVVQYESESKAGFFPRTAVNGNSGLWTGRKLFVSQVGVAKIEFDTSPNAEIVVALFNRPTQTSVLASRVPDPLSSSDGWYDNVEELKEKYGLMEVFGTPESPGGYWPRQKTGTHSGPLTGKLRDSSSTLYDSPYGGFVWCYVFTSVSTWVTGRVFPAVEQ